MFFLDDIPPKVSIDEAVELGKKFGTEESGSFINGILDNVYIRNIKDDADG
jgi:transcription termination factor NusB